MVDIVLTTLNAKYAHASFGLRYLLANLGPLREWGLELRDNRHLVVDTAMRTNIPGVFAAGDITDYGGKVRLISVGFGEVATAVNNAAVHLDPSAHVFPGHTSNEPHDVPVPA